MRLHILCGFQQPRMSGICFLPFSQPGFPLSSCSILEGLQVKVNRIHGIPMNKNTADTRFYFSGQGLLSVFLRIVIAVFFGDISGCSFLSRIGS